MPPVVSTSRVQSALEQVPVTPPEQDESRFGWVMDDELIRRWEQFGPLRDGVHEMAAHALADVTEAMLDSPVCDSDSPRILLIAGPGGNGADGLRAGRVLAERGRKVDVMILLSGERGYSLDYPESHDNKRLLAELTAAGGTVITGAHIIEEDITRSHAIILEAIVGSGFHGTLEGLMASWAEMSGWVPSVAVDIPAGVEADTGDLPLLRGEPYGRPAEHYGRRHPPTVTVALGALRPAPTTAHCGSVLLARCGLKVEHDFNADFSRLIGPDLGCDAPETVNDMVMDVGESLADSWGHVRRSSVCAVIGGIDCLGFGHLALQALRGAGTWHRLSLLAGEETTARLVTQHPDVDVHLELAAATVQPPEVWVVESRDVDTLAQVLQRGEKVLLGPRAVDALQRADLLALVRAREGETTLITRDAGLAELGAGATVVQLTDQVITTHLPNALEPGEIARDYHDPVVPLGQVQGVEAVLAGICAVSSHYMALAFLADRMQQLKPHWPVSAADLARPTPSH